MLTIKSTHVIVLLTLITLPLTLIAQVSKKSDVMGFDRYYQQANKFYSQGDYFRAGNLYRACLRLPSVSPEVQTELLLEVKRVVSVQKLFDDGATQLRHGNNEQAKITYKKILDFNPNDRIAKETLINLNKPTVDWAKEEKLADKFLKQNPPNYTRVHDILVGIPLGKRSPSVIEKLKQASEMPYRLSVIDRQKKAGIDITKAVNKIAQQYPEDPNVIQLKEEVKDENEY